MFFVQLQIAFAVFLITVLAQPANDNCLGAVSAVDGVYAGDTTGASVETNLTRDFSPCSGYFHDIWFSYVASCTGVASASVTGACDLAVASWQGTCSGFTSRVCEDAGGDNGGELLYFRVAQNSSYFVSVADYNSACFGPVSMNITCTPSPNNNNCPSAVVIHDGHQTGFTNVGATVGGNTSANNPCGSSYFHDVWFVYNATCTGKTTVRVGHTEADLEVASWIGSNCSLLTGLVCGDTGESKEADKVTFATVEGQLAYVSVASYSFGDFASFDVSVTCVPTPPVPANDECTGAKAVGNGVIYDSLFGATHSKVAGNCSSDADVWFNYTAPCTGLATITVEPYCATDEVTLQLWGSKGCANATAGGCVDAGSPSETKQFFVVVGMGYLFLVGSKLTDPYTGDLAITTSCVPTAPPPANDNCTGAYRVVDGQNNAANLGATLSTRNTGCESINSDVWFRYTANCTGITTASLSFDQDEVLVAWTGSNCTTLTSYQCVRNGPVSFPTVQGSSYYISAGSYDVYQGPLLLTISCSKPVPTVAPTRAPTAVPTVSGCPDLKNFLSNCSATNFTDNAQCTLQCAQAASHIFEGTNLSTSTKVQCLSVINSTWTPASVSVLTQRLNMGSSLCRSIGFQLIWSWVPLFLILIHL